MFLCAHIIITIQNILSLFRTKATIIPIKHLKIIWYNTSKPLSVRLLSGYNQNYTDGTTYSICRGIEASMRANGGTSDVGNIQIGIHSSGSCIFDLLEVCVRYWKVVTFGTMGLIESLEIAATRHRERLDASIFAIGEIRQTVWQLTGWTLVRSPIFIRVITRPLTLPTLEMLITYCHTDEKKVELCNR